jgi:Ca2+/Na+ antiporter
MPHNGAVMLTVPFLYPMHFGHLPWWQQLLVLLLAFGPFLILGVVVYVVRQKDIAAEEAEQAQGAGQAGVAGQAGRETGGDQPGVA